MYKEYFPSINNFVVRNSGNEQDASDIFQNALLIFFDHVKQDRFEGAAKIKTYLFAICKNLWLKELKKRNRQALRFSDDIPDTLSGESIDQIVFSGEKSLTLLKLVEQLGEGCQQILKEYYYRGLSVTEIKEINGFSNEGSVKNKKYRCLQQLIALVQGSGISADDIELDKT